jgi:hypothetical protein
VDGVEDLGVVDALQVDGGDAKVAVAELASDDDQRDAFAGHLDSVRVAELRWREAPAHTGRGGAGVARGRRRWPRIGRLSRR